MQCVCFLFSLVYLKSHIYLLDLQWKIMQKSKDIFYSSEVYLKEQFKEIAKVLDSRNPFIGGVLFRLFTFKKNNHPMLIILWSKHGTKMSCIFILA